MSPESRYGGILRRFEFVTVVALQVLLVLLIAIATIFLYLLFVKNLRENVAQIETVDILRLMLQRGFGGVLIVLLGLELLETLRDYFSEHHIRVEVILIVAMIAVGRHIIQVDIEHAPGLLLFGLGGLMVSLALGYFLIKRAQIQPPSA